ncbi:MAG: aromatic ring-hydroxylating dioxygenase subunit alpha [Thermosynechococcaceae cyanobacterium MS004]|nr:aromatic ring-hydroxylating dioxygenase subunit alpha [Thermosynechococcaceae cyanobacterium MS004]
MELTTTLSAQTVRNAVREAGINANYWYAVGWAKELLPGAVMSITVWKQAIALYRDGQGQVQALEDACPHRGVALHKGQVKGCHLVCPYHGWEFNPEGQCVNIPYLSDQQKLPTAKARSYPVQEKYGILWVFPGNPNLATQIPIIEIPEYGRPDLLMIPITGHFKAHFSICNENALDVFHGFLHQGLQGWFDPELAQLKETPGGLHAIYNVSYKGRMAKFLGLSDRADTVTTVPISIDYRYPNYATALEGVSSLYLMRLPVDAQESRSFALFFFKVNLPQGLLNLLRPVLLRVLPRFVLYRFLAQDVEMMESEQQNYTANPHRIYAEINPAIIALQRVTLKQYESYLTSQETAPQTTKGQNQR